MGLFKKTTLLFTFLILIALSSAISLTVSKNKLLLQEQLARSSQDFAVALSQSVNINELASMTSSVNALFDQGDYQSILIYDAKNTLIYERKQNQNLADIPQWFVSLLPVVLDISMVEVSSGWEVSGLIEVQANTATAQKKLWDNFKYLLQFFSLIAIIALAIFTIVFKIILRYSYKQ